MPALTAADTIRILVATDNHVGYNELDPVRGDDSWKSFHEIMCVAKDRDVDMVLLGGDLFHDNKPSRKALYNVMRSLRMNCFGPRPCELECLTDGSEHFDGTFGFANYEDPNLNVSIPVFSIHGNHDDPSGSEHLASLDILGMGGLLNYFGRTLENDVINVKPVLFQKGRTKLALYGMSNVRDERLWHTIKKGNLTFDRPDLQKQDWFHLCCVHQNHTAHTATSYLPEDALPEFLDLVIWGHEHECKILPNYNPSRDFRVMQPGSSVATSLIAGEAVPKQICILTVTGREFKSEPIRLKTVRPFVYKDIVLSDYPKAVKIAKKENHRTELTRFLMTIVTELIEDAKKEWQEAQGNEPPSSSYDSNCIAEGQDECPLPLVRLRVENSAADAIARFDCENPQRFSGRFQGLVANTTDVIQYYTKKKNAASRRGNREADALVDKEILSKILGAHGTLTFDTVQIEELVKEYLNKQSLTILPQNSFGNAVTDFISKDDKHAMEIFINESLAGQMKHLMDLQHAARNPRANEDFDFADYNERDLGQQIDDYRGQLEELFKNGLKKTTTTSKKRYRPKPEEWDSDFDGHWVDTPGSLLRPDEMGGQNGFSGLGR